MTTENGLTDSRDISVSMKARYYKANSSKQSVPHPFAEGARGWVNPTLESQVKLTTANNANVYIANKANANISVISKETSLRLFSKETALRLFCKRTQDERGNPQIHTPLSSLRAFGILDFKCVAIQNQTRLTQKMDCHENPCGFSRNDE